VRAELTGLRLADPPERWAALGFSVGDSRFALGGVGMELGMPGSGIVGWTLTGIDPTADIDGLPTAVAEHDRPPHVDHDNGAVAVDHVVVRTTSFDRTAAALERAGMPLRRTITSPSGNRMGFRRLGPAILELVEGSDGESGPARFWGLVVIVADLDALAARLGDRLGSIRDAVQPGRRIATLRESAGLGHPMAFMSPELRSPEP
jgi:hypothetical protein